ncbi:zinc-ribbon domain-containing protein [Candidatus Stoquefichus massiliensis]|uniref:zinc-ribbon domain-containing protein n=1 Tax=Candidatus Stoquefichus massiliensis TaxID=1470350 RepID=UPI0004849C27|nr:zinc ribbon domain-containing protein [Candidatus Stoquefichus massiliensis]
MYCRKCGAKLNDTAKFCDSCGEAVIVVKQRSDSQKYEERQTKETKKKSQQKIEELKNPYVIPALGTAILAFGLAIFPWPVSWGIGTSLWMRILILLIALLSDYHCTKSRQVNNLYNIQYRYRVQPQLVTTATVLATLTTAVALFALINM